MIQLKLFFIIFLLLASPSLASAEQSSGDQKPRPPILLKKGHKGDYTKCPKAPDCQSITCTYDGITMELTLTISEGISTLTVIDQTPQCIMYTIDPSYLFVSVPVGTLAGSINIELDTERGNHFTGIFE